MRVLIVDDEAPARDKLRRLLAFEADVTEVAEARDGIDALQQIAASAPDVVFLDIQMPGVSGIELAASLPAPVPLIVFVTAFDQYAISAFDANAIDYLLKPYDRERLRRSLARVRARLRPGAPADRLGMAPDTGQPVRQLLVTERGVTRIVRVDQIGWIETADNYVVLHCAHEQPLMRQTLAGLLDKLGPGFMRCHRRAAVRLACVERIIALDKGDCELLLSGGALVPCSRQYRSALIARL
ncbi:LytR/AlgR family response regulator transcription factor [Massilia glaciei]|uniref:DNA-binding response regulator n=1 Tax=Massilia glaciei TaxID=1524097 RepID=A0A2U2HLB3_9BURK|nr:response regulator [Massilia glaciei]PWF48294.1 DNA-binding response regulator [Massilia glaciei]